MKNINLKKNFFLSLFFILLIIALIHFLIQIKFYSILSSQSDEYVEPAKIHIEEVNDIWTVSIPSINLQNATIANGTDETTLNSYVGHFENTDFINGNIGLAAHNRGYNINYFENLKNINIKDIIVYTYEKNVFKYEVILKKEIDSYDWSYLEKTNEDLITLITCVDGRPDRRLCVQGRKI